MSIKEKRYYVQKFLPAKNTLMKQLLFQIFLRVPHSVENGSPPVQYFFDKSCVVQGQWLEDRPRQLVTHYGEMHLVSYNKDRSFWLDIHSSKMAGPEDLTTPHSYVLVRTNKTETWSDRIQKKQ